MREYFHIRRDDGRFLTGEMVAGGAVAKWTDNPSFAYTYEPEDAERAAARFRDLGFTVVVILWRRRR